MALQTGLKAILVNSLSTKFLHKGDHLEFQIALSYDKGQILVKDFDNYDTYRESHDRLVKALNEDALIPDDFTRI
jgi:hypothetical protein